MEPTDDERDAYEAERAGEAVQPEEAFDPGALSAALRRLTMLGDDPYLSMQATNLGLVDAFISLLERQLMQALYAEDGTPPDAAFVLAQSQMWIFAAYELLRTWRQRAKDTLKLIRTGGLEARLTKLEAPLSYRHPTREIRVLQLRQVAALPDVEARLDADLRRIHVTFGLMEALRMSLAKHEVPKQKDSVAFAPGYGRINMWTGAIDFELSVGRTILGQTNRRELADGFRHIWDAEPQSWDELAGFNSHMRGFPDGEDPFVDN